MTASCDRAEDTTHRSPDIAGLLLRACLTWNMGPGAPDRSDCGPDMPTAPNHWAQWRPPSQLPCQPLAHPQCPSPLPGLAASLPVEGLIMNLLPAQLWLLWARGCFSPASGRAAPASLRVVLWCRQGRESLRWQGLHLQAWVCLVLPPFSPGPGS